MMKGNDMHSALTPRRATAFFLSSALCALVSGAAGAQGQQADVLITGGTVYDGSTAKPFTGDVAITGDKIIYVGPKAPMGAKRVIDAHGMIVSPGLIQPSVTPTNPSA